ncbi:MAG: hypothetical protein ACYTGN_07755 [Planctomycetota bacterium]|jgi:cyanophycin synthetase
MYLREKAVRALWILRARIRKRLARAKPQHHEYWHGIWAEAATAAGAELNTLGDARFEIRQGERSVQVNGSLVGLDTRETLNRAGDKPLVHRLLTEAGLAVPPFVIYEFPDFAAGWAFVQREAPCVVKPSRGTAGGRGVTTGVTSRRAFRRASYAASIYCDELVVEKQVPGDVYRLLYLDGKLLDAVRRGCPRVTGDGSSTVRQLIAKENRRRALENAPSTTRAIATDDDCVAAVQRAGYTLASVLPAGVEVEVRGTTNDGGVAESESVLDAIGPAMRDAGARAAEAIGVRLAGVDMISPDPEDAGVVLEVNTTPGLQWHYLVRNTGQAQKVAIPVLSTLLQS